MIRARLANLFLLLVLVGRALAGATAPMITTQPASQTVTLGAKATFSVVASGTAPLSYQWSRNGSAITGATSASYTTAATVAADSGASFTVKVSNSAGTKTSSAATLTLNRPPSITTQPANRSVVVGSTATFSVVATGTGTLVYQWSKNGTQISGATSATYTTLATVAGDSGASFTVKVSNSYGNVTSSAAILTVTAPVAPTITTQPTSKTVTLGSTAAFTVTASGTAPLTYQWFKNGSSITGATSASYTTPATGVADNGAVFTVKVTNAGGTATSNAATLTLNLPPTISTQPANQSVVVGGTATFSVGASGTGTLTYQWSKKGVAISGATAASYTTPATVIGDNTATFTVKVTNSYGTVTSSTATLTVTPTVAPSITTQPSAQVVTLGSTATFSVVASGTAPLTYQWYKNGSAITGATTASYTTPATVAADGGTSFTVKVTNTSGTVTSSAATLTVNLPPSISTQPSSQSVTLGSTATFSVVASGTGALSYQWSKNGTPISGAASASYTTFATVAGDNASTFSVKVTNAFGVITSSTATLTVVAPVPPSITTQPANLTVNLGATATFSVVAAGTAPLTYQWSKNGGVITGATSASYTAPATVVGDNGAGFSVVISNAAGSITSNIASLTVNLPPSISVQPVGQTVDLGATATFTVTASGSGTLSYQWLKNGAQISGATGSSYTTSATVKADSGEAYSVKVSNALGNVTSNTASLVVNPVTVSVAPAAIQVSTSATQTFTATVSGAVNKSVTWSVTGGSTKGTITSAGVYTAPSVAASDSVVATSSADNTKTGSAAVTVALPVSIAITPTVATITVGRGMKFGYSIQNTSNTSVSWSVIETGGGTVDGSGNYTAPSTPGVFTVQVASVADGTKVSQAKVTVVASPDGTITAPGTITSGATGLVASVPSQSGSTFAWSLTGGTVTAGASTNRVTFMAGTGTSLTLTCKVTNGAGDSLTSNKTLPIVPAQPVSVSVTPTTVTLAPGGTQLFTATVTGSTNLNTTWSYSQGTLVQSGGGMLYTAPATTGTYSITVSSDADPTKTATATINVQPPGVNVSVTPTVVTVAPGAVQNFAATVTGSTNTSVTWAVVEAGGGTINASGAYTAPATTGTYTVRATAVADATKVATATVNVSNSIVTISISPSTVTLVPGETQLFTATVAGTSNLNTQWTYNGGTLVQSGGGMLFTAPTKTGTYTITVASAADPTKTAKATVTVSTSVPVSISVSPVSTTLPLGGTQTFTAAVSGTTNKAVTWSVTGGTTKGTITAAGVYTAPSSAVTDTVIAKSVADATKTASATVTVSAVTVAISPTTITLASGMELLFTATVTGAAQDVIWSVTEPGGGTIYANGNYVTPAVTGTYHVVARSQAFPAAYATSTVTVVPPVVLTITPPKANIVSGNTATFTANVPVTWGFAGGIGGRISYNSTQATYTPPTGALGAETLTATSKLDPSKEVDIRIWVRAVGSPVISSFTSSTQRIQAGEPVTLSWSGTGATSGSVEARNRPTGNSETVNVDPVAASSVVVSPLENTTYTLELANDSGVDQQEIVIQVDVPSVDSFVVDDPKIPLGGSTILRGTFTNGTGDLQPGVGPVTSGFAVPISPATRTSYTLTVTNPLGVSKSATVYVTPEVSAGNSVLSGVLTEPRYDHRATRLLDGRVLISGGLLAYGVSAPNNAEVFDPAAGTFSQVTFGQGIGQSATLLLDGRVLMVGGVTATGPFAIKYYYQQYTSIWDPMTGVVTNPAGPQRMYHSATLLLDGRVLIVGGDALNYMTLNYEGTATALIFDPISGTQTPVGSMIQSVGANEAVLLSDGRVLVSGSDSIEIFDPNTQSFSVLQSNARLSNPISLADGRVLGSQEIINPATGSHSPVAVPGQLPPAMLGDGRVFSGYLGAYPYDSAIFDPRVGTLLGVGPALRPRDRASTTLLQDGRVLVTGGITANEYNNVLEAASEIFTPANALTIQGNGGFAKVGEVVHLALSGSAAGQAVTWSCTGGTIDASGNWSAPNVPGVYWVTVTSQADSTIRATARYQLYTIQVKFTQSSYSLVTLGQVTLKASVTGATNPALTWTVVEGGVAGSITQTGVFTAGNTPGVYHVVATSVADPTKSATATITVQLPPVLNLTPLFAQTAPGIPVQFSAPISHSSDQSVSWSVTETTWAGISPTGLFMATAPGIYHVNVFAWFDSTLRATAEVLVSNIASISINPAHVTLSPGETILMSRDLRAVSDSDIDLSSSWSATGGIIAPIGSLSDSASFTAPATPGIYTVTVSSNETPSLIASATIRVVAGVVGNVSVLPARITLAPGDTQTFLATVSGGGPVVWSASGGSIDGSGVFTAPALAGEYTVQATNGTHSGTALVSVTKLPIMQRFSASSVRINEAETATLNWAVKNATNLKLDSGTGPLDVTGTLSKVVNPSSDTVYSLTATNAFGSVVQSIRVSVVQLPTIVSFIATPGHVNPGDAVTLSWVTKGADAVVLDPMGTNMGTATSSVQHPTRDTTYILTAVNSYGGANKTVTVLVGAALPTLGYLRLDPATARPGDPVTISWSVQGAGAVSLSTFGAVEAAGSRTFTAPASATRYTLTATNAYGTITPYVDLAQAQGLKWTGDRVYGFGQLVSEDKPNGNGVVTTYVQADQVGSADWVTDANGASVGQAKNLPFGERFGSMGTQSSDRYAGHEDQPGSAVYMQARLYLPEYGRFASPDPARDQHLEDTQSWNIYLYVRNQPTMKIDPTGMETFLVTYTTGNSKGDDEFKRAAETRAKEIQGRKSFDSDHDTVLIRGVRTKDDFRNAINEANAMENEFGKVRGIDLFSHAGPKDGPVFHQAAGRTPTFLSKIELGSMKVNWGPDASASFYGCNTAQNFAQAFANAQRVRSYGFASTGYFSSDPDKRVDFGPDGPLYLINARGMEHEPLAYAFERIFGVLPARSMVEKIPKEGL